MRVASALRVAVGQCANAMLRRERALDLEARLLDTDDAVDRLIAQFASVHMGDDSSEKGNGYQHTGSKAMDDIRDVRRRTDERP